MGEAFVVTRPDGAALRALNYAPEVERLRARGGADAPALGSMLSDLGPAYGAVFIRVDCDPEHGIELITQGDMFAAEPLGRVIRRDSMARPERHLVKRWQVLIAGAGTLGENELYGRAIIADTRLEGRYVGPHAMVLTFKEPGADQSLLTYAFLLTRIGLRAIRAASFGTKILGLRKDLLRALPVPIPSRSVCRRVADLVRSSVEHRELWLAKIREARQALESLAAMREAHELCARRQARSVVWTGELRTLSAWNFASPGKALQHLKSCWRGRLGDVIAEDGLFYGGRSSRIPCRSPHGVDFISQRDAFLVRPIPRRVLLPGVPRELLFARENSLLIAARGTLGEGELFGRPVLATGALLRYGVTEDLLRLVPRDDHTATTYAYLSTLVGLRLLRSTAVGTKILNLRFDLLRELPFPELSRAQVTSVAGSVKAAADAKERAENDEAKAVSIVEEEVLPAWLA